MIFASYMSPKLSDCRVCRRCKAWDMQP